MGCFSFICKVTGKAVLSSSFDGDAVHLFLLKDGKVIESMHGNYDSYGRVFSQPVKDEGLTDSFEWKMPWNEVVDLMFDDDRSNGIAAILGAYWKKGDDMPVTRSKGDPNQGWGDDIELLGYSGKGFFKKVDKPKHIIYNDALNK